MSEKSMIFVEDKSKPYYDVIEAANNWIRFNLKKHSSFKCIRTVLGVKKDVDGSEEPRMKPEKYDRIVTVYYTCDDELSDPSKCDHSSTKEEIITQPTCYSLGKKKIICEKCGVVVRTEPIPKTSHTFGEWVIIKEPTCDSEGIKKKVCNICEESETAPIPMLEHEYGEWVTVKEPTIDEEGLEERYCIHDCGSKESRPIDRIPLNINITTNVIDGITMDEEYSKQLEADVSNLHWSLTSGSIPGLTLSDDGILSGTPTTDGIYNITVKAAYDEERFATKSFVVNVAHGAWTVTFDPNGGTCDITSIKVADGSNIGALPVPTNGDMVFGGWFTAAVDGLKVDENYSINSDVTLYARWGSGSGIEFGDATSSFNISYNGERTNYQNNPYTFYSRYSNGNTSNLVFQTGISSQNGSNNMDASNKEVKLYMKVTNNGAAGSFDIGFDCDSYIPGKGDDRVVIERLVNGVSLASGAFKVTVPYETAIWAGVYSARVENRYNDVAVGSKTGDIDSGYSYTMKNIFINSGSYAILEVTFQIP